MNGQRALEDHRPYIDKDPLYGEEMERIVGKPKKNKTKSKKSKGKGLPDPQYLMMLKMMDPNIDMVKSKVIQTSIIEGAMGIKKSPSRDMDDEVDSDDDLYDPDQKRTTRAGRDHPIKSKKAKIPAKLEQMLVNQNKMIETLTHELKSLKGERQEEGREELQKQIERLEKMLEKKEQKAEQEEFHYQLKRVALDHHRTWLSMSKAWERS